MDSGFYRAFEDRYRGSRELISSRLEAYLPFLAPLKTLYQDLPVLDLGCGRGEWLELLCREGYAPTGVDLDDGMLDACHALSLPASKDDAISALQKLPDNSLVAVTGFHLAEHIPFPVLQQLVAEALRVLRPAGLLILETPNAESLVVGTNSFYLDPTHERPLPNLLLSFLTEHSGFVKSKIVRLQEEQSLHDASRQVGVWDVLAGTSPDYSIVAQKEAAPEQLAAFETAFETSYGVSLDQLAVRYDQALERRFSGLEDQMAVGQAEYLTRDNFREAMESIQNRQTEQLLALQERSSNDMAVLQKQCFDLQQRHNDVAARADALQVDLNASLGNAHNWYLRAMAYEQQLEAMRHSTSWRITGPFRFAVRAVSWPFRSGRATAGQILRRGATHARLWLACRPALHRTVTAVLNRLPGLQAKLRSLHENPHVAQTPASASDPQHGVIDHAPLTQRGRIIESALKEAMMKGRK
jgi:2-polyprenyl-3-methyl-5-hydroxy-6-metoxy-1,4-benzoquinol methylase